ncbi:tat (twin-arginine translocation) pathway signal sequence [Streptomyces sp. NPDC047880]|uniref:tat (twin-arginine translocation) pathway signal sequence n=1 Tax=Streptomyces sp. NPDC047880 TaxID=3155626 RepID=UPI0034524A63
MNSHLFHPRLTTAPGRRIGVLTATSGALLAAFFVVPGTLAHDGVDSGNVAASFRRGLVAYWDSGSPDFPRQLDTTVEFWFRFHLVKAVVSALLLAAVVVLGVLLGRLARQRADGRPGRRLLVPAGALVALLGPFALVALVANVQGAVAPFASLLPMLTGGDADTDGELAGTLAQMRQQIADHPAEGHSPPLAAMIGDFALYHAVLAAMAATAGLALAGVAAALWRRRRAAPGTRSRRAMKAGVAASALCAALALVIAVANTTSAAHSSQALAAFLDGGW